MENKKYSAKDIKVLNFKDGILKRPEMYFGSRGINASAIATAISEGAILLGASRTQVYHLSGWWYVCADLDWLKQPNQNRYVTEETIFETIHGFPEWGVNSFRSEALARVFSTCTFTLSNAGINILTGNEVDLPHTEIEKIKNNGWLRTIGFKFDKSA